MEEEQQLLKLGVDISIDSAKTMDLDVRADGFHNALHVAAWNHNEAAALAILDRPEAKELLFEQQIEGATPLFIAVQSHMVQMVEKILSMLSTKELEKILDMKLNNGTTVVQRAVLNMHEAGTLFGDVDLKVQKQLAIDADEIIQLLFEKAGDELIAKYNPEEFLEKLFSAEERESVESPPKKKKKSV
jgi:hypothetical protein